MPTECRQDDRKRSRCGRCFGQPRRLGWRVPSSTNERTRRPARVDLVSRIPTSTARGCSTRPSSGRTTCASTACGCKGMLDEPAPSSSRAAAATAPTSSTTTTCRPSSRSFVRVEPRHMQFHADAIEHGFIRPREPTSTTRANPPSSRRLVDDACIFLNRPGLRGRRRLCAAHRRRGGRRATARLETAGLLAGAAPARTLRRRVGPRHLTAP